MFIKKEKIITKFTSKENKVIEIIEPSFSYIHPLLEFVNRLVIEDTFLSLSGKPKSLAEEKLWLKNTIEEIKRGKSLYFWAKYDNRIVGSVSITKGLERSLHVGEVGLMVDKDHRGKGIGRFLLELILKEAQRLDIKIATLKVFEENVVGIKLYQRLGFKNFGNLSNGVFRKGKYSNNIYMYKKLSQFV